MVPRENVPGVECFFLCLGGRMMKYRTSDEVRDLFLNFFASKGHMIEPGAPLVPIDDNTLLWINSGVAALKKYFDGRVKPSNPRITNAQKSLRTNDIDNVGKTARHHTFFEMLGNFSIGDYFKKEAIEFAYEFLFSKEWLGLDVKDAYFSVYKDDTEAYDIWVSDIGIDPKRILKTEDNFWQIGDGPCGPNSEIFIDRGPSYDPDNIGEELFFKDIENDRYVEIWNIVFSQFDGVDGGDRALFKELPQRNIDTGMGFERLVSIVQNGKTNYDTDLFLPIIHEAEKFSEISYEENVMAYRVIADHIRSLVFTLSDGATFSNEGRGYVLRRILRRAVRFGRVLDIKESFLHQLVDVVIETQKHFYPDLTKHKVMVKELILSEEKRFERTLHDGETLLLKSLQESENHTLNGEMAFKLYDTYGFPIELTQEIAAEEGYSVDLEGFTSALEAQKERARSSRHKDESMASQQEDIMNFDLESIFNYDAKTLKTNVIACFVDGKRVDSFTGKGSVVFEETLFYAESGGQVSDYGQVEFASETVSVDAVSKARAGQHLHTIMSTQKVQVGDQVTLVLDDKRRHLIRKNHSAVHLLQSALRLVLGEHVTQAGSYVDDQYLRFDFSHFEKVKSEDLEKVSDIINEWISQSLIIHTEIMDVDSAKASGAMALFSENYGSSVRVVSIGNVSKELCGGNHASNSADLGLFKIVSEESVGSGVRRIVAKVSLAALSEYKAYEKTLQNLRTDLKIPHQKTVQDRVMEMAQEIKDLEAVQAQLQSEIMVSKASTYAQKAVSQNDLSVLIFQEENLDADLSKLLVEKINHKVDVVVLCNLKESSINFVVACSKNAIEKGYKAGELAKIAAVASDGNGGGRPNFAQSGGKTLSKLKDAIDEIEKKLAI